MARSKKAQAAIESALLVDQPGQNVGLGVDLVEVARMERILERTPSFKAKVFSPDERAYCDGRARPAMHYAARFAAKEAVVKALGLGFSSGISVRDIEVVRAEGGRPSIQLSGRALEEARAQGVTDIPVSLSHTATGAIACAMALTPESAIRREPKASPQEELARQFKEARQMLDELDASPASSEGADAGEAEDASDAQSAEVRS